MKNTLFIIVLLLLAVGSVFSQGQSQLFTFPSWDDGLRIDQQYKNGTTTPTIKASATKDTSLTLYFNSAPGDTIVDIVAFTNFAAGLNGMLDSLADSTWAGVKLCLGNNGQYATRDTLALDSLKKVGTKGASIATSLSSDSDRVARNIYLYMRGLNKNARFNCCRLIVTFEALRNASTQNKGGGLLKPFTYSAALITRRTSFTPPSEQLLRQEQQKQGGR